MADSKLNLFLSSGTAAERAAFTPDPPTPATGAAYTYLWYEEDTGRTYVWDAAGADWVQSGGSAIPAGGVVRAATTANITIATALNNGDTLDGVSLVTGDLVLVKDQSAAAENGIYVVGVSPARHGSFDAYNDHPGIQVTVSEGTVNADTNWQCTSNAGGTIDVTAIAFLFLSSPYIGKGCMVRKAADLTGQNFTAGAVITFDTEVYDDLGFHNLCDPSFLTVPAGVTRVDIAATIRLANLTSGNLVQLSVTKNGTAVYDGAPQITTEATLTGGYTIEVTGLSIPCVAGDDFECNLFVESDTSVDITATRTSFTIRVAR
jgi:hypothetical protein